jgi:carboxylesterase type B
MCVDFVGLFHRAVSQSGTAFCPWALAPHGSSTHQAEKLAALLDCPTHPSTELVACLRRKDAVDVTATKRDFEVSREKLQTTAVPV